MAGRMREENTMEEENTMSQSLPAPTSKRTRKRKRTVRKVRGMCLACHADLRGEARYFGRAPCPFCGSRFTSRYDNPAHPITYIHV